MKILNFEKAINAEKQLSSCGRVGPACNCNTQCTRLGKNNASIDVRDTSVKTETEEAV